MARDIAITVLVPGVQPTYRRNFVRFVGNYLGTAGRDVVFGGRSVELAELHRWVRDESAPRRMLVTGPAGRGKSALIVRWCETVSQSVPTAFVPISIRFETSSARALYTLLAGKLAQISGRQLPGVAADPAGTYAEFCADVLDEFEAASRPLLIVVDGLDEAVGWEIGEGLLGPDRPNLRVLVCARPMVGEPEQRNGERWLERLGWRYGRDATILELEPLTPEGVAGVVAALDLPAGDGAGTATLVGELARLSEGDPLLLGYLVEDLRERPHASPDAALADLRARASGFEDYFRRWIEQQKPVWLSGGQDMPTLEALLTLLSCAIGPLTPDDLDSLLAQTGRSQAVVLERPLQDLGRFVLQVEGGFVLAHPRLGEHLRTRFFRTLTPIAVAKRAFLDWSAATLDSLERDASASISGSRYLARFMLRHMVEAGLPAAQVMRVTGLAWLRLCESATGDLMAYSTQVRAAADYARARAGAGDPRLGWTVAAQLVLNSVRNSASIPPALLAACVGKNVLGLNRALAHVALANMEERVRGTVALLPFIHQTQHQLHLDQAVGQARSIEDLRARTRALAAVAAVLPSGTLRGDLEGELVEACDQAGSMYEWWLIMEQAAQVVTGGGEYRLVDSAMAHIRDGRWRYLHAILPHLGPEPLRYAWHCIRALQYGPGELEPVSGLRHPALAVLFRYLPEPLKTLAWRDALDAARDIESKAERAVCLASIHNLLPPSIQAEVGSELLADARDADGFRKDYIDGLAEVCVLVGGELGQIALSDAAAKAISSLAQENFSRLAPVAPLLHGPLLAQAYEAAIAAPGQRARSEALAELAPQLDADQLRAALAAVTRFDDALPLAIAEAALATSPAAGALAPEIRACLDSVPGNADTVLPYVMGGHDAAAWPFLPGAEDLLVRKQDKGLISRALDPEGASVGLRGRIIQRVVSAPEHIQLIMSVARHLKGGFATMAAEWIYRHDPDNETLKSAHLCALALLLANLGEAPRRRALKTIENGLDIVTPEHLATVAKELASAYGDCKAAGILKKAEEVIAAAAPDKPALLASLVDLGADPISILGRLVALGRKASRYDFAPLLARSGERDTKAMVDAFVQVLMREGDDPLQWSLQDEFPETVKVAIIEQLPLLSARSTRKDLLVAATKAAWTIRHVEGEAGLLAVRTAIRTLRARFP